MRIDEFLTEMDVVVGRENLAASLNLLFLDRPRTWHLTQVTFIIFLLLCGQYRLISLPRAKAARRRQPSCG